MNPDLTLGYRDFRDLGFEAADIGGESDPAESSSRRPGAPPDFFRSEIEHAEEPRLLQQTASHVMEIMERKIRSGARALIANPNQIEVRDQAGSVITRFSLQVSGSVNKLFEGSTVLAPLKLDALTFTPNSDTTVVQIFLELEDPAYNKVSLKASAALRNHVKLRNLRPE